MACVRPSESKKISCYKVIGKLYIHLGTRLMVIGNEHKRLPSGMACSCPPAISAERGLLCRQLHLSKQIEMIHRFPKSE